MANESKTYEVRITIPVNENPEVFVFRSCIPLDMAVDLARSIWLSTDNSFLAVSVVEENCVVPCITFRSRE